MLCLACGESIEGGGRPRPPPPVATPLGRTDRSALVLSGDLALPLGGDVVEGRVGSLLSLNRRRSLNNRRQVLEHLGIGVAGIGIPVFFRIPQAIGAAVLAIGF